MPRKLARTDWYDYTHIDKLLKTLSHNQQDYLVADAITKDALQSTQRVSDALVSLNNHLAVMSIAIPINLGNPVDGVWTGVHWVGLSISKTAAGGYKALYADSCMGKMDTDLPFLRQILDNHGIQDIVEVVLMPQQTNGYDCGPWTIFNLDSLARTNILPLAIDETAIINQRTNLNVILLAELYPEFVLTDISHAPNATAKYDDGETSAINRVKLQSLVHSIQQNIQTFTRGVAGHIADEVILVVGSTKSGKTTFMNMIAGKQMEVVEDEDGACSVDVVGKDYAGAITAPAPVVTADGVTIPGFERMKIGQTADSTTKLPNYVTVGNVQFWDCPGFGDTREPDVDISNMYYVRHIIKHVTATGRGGVKFVIVQDHDSTAASRSDSFKKAINTVCKMLPPESPEALIRLINATTFVFTKVYKSEMGPKYLEKLFGRSIPKLAGTEEQISIEDAVYITFMQTMQEMHRADSTRIKHVEVPQAYDGIAPHALHNPVQASIDLALHPSTPTLQNCASKLVISPKSQDVLMELVYSCQSELKAECTGPLGTRLVEVFKGMPDGLAANKMSAMVKILPINKAVFECGGATKVANKLLHTLKAFSREAAYTQTLSDISKTLQTLEFCNDVVSGALRGADFTQITEACRVAATTYISDEENRQLKLYNSDLGAYLAEQDGKYLAAKVAAAPLMLVGGIVVLLLNFDGKGEDAQGEAGGILKSFYHKVYGKLSKPSKSDEQQFVDIKQLVGEVHESQETV